MPLILAENLQLFATTVLRQVGATPAEAQLVGQSLVDANLAGYESHGVMRLPSYVEMLQQGETVSGVPLKILDESDTRLVGDAQWGFGRVQAGRLLDALMDKASAHGTAVGTLKHCGHVGRLGEYCELAAAMGFVSEMMVNTHGTARRVAPPGGIAPRIGTNPLALGVPAEDGPLILDFSTSATAEGKVRVRRIAGQECPQGWLLDAQGQPTTDPRTLYATPPGTILPMGGPQTYKGFGLGLMIEIFTGALAGGLCAREQPTTPKGNCVFLLLLNPDHFGGRAVFAREVRELVAYVRGCPRATGVDEILLPGDPERRARARQLRDGIELDDLNWRELEQLAGRLGVAIP